MHPGPTSPSVYLALLRAYWPALLFLALVYGGRLAWGLYRWCRLAASGVADIDRMDGRTFERYLETLFTRLGYRVELTRYAGDWGADLVIAKGGARTAVQAKRWKRVVGVRAVQEAVAAKGKYGCAGAMVVTNSTFTAQARELARANGVVLHDRHWLAGELLSAGQGTPTESASGVGTLLPPPAASGAEVCDACGRPVSERVAAYCRQNAARFDGRVFCFDHQKGGRRRTE